MRPPQKTIYRQEPLFAELKKDICYICYRWIKGDGVYVGKGTWRHKKCKPDSPHPKEAAGEAL